MEPVPIEFLSAGDRVSGRFYPAERSSEPATLLFAPGWPATHEDFLGLGPLLSQQGINLMEFYYRGIPPSDGTYTHTGALQDFASAWQWLSQMDVQSSFKVISSKLVIGGYSHGGGLAMVYAAQNPGVQRIISCAGNDFGEFARELRSNSPRIDDIRTWLVSTQAPKGPVQFDPVATVQELIDHPEIFGLRENAERLADRTILLFGGWEDIGPTVDQYQLPLYRSLKAAGAKNVTFIVYHTDHSFSNVRQQLAKDVAEWIIHHCMD